jgi:hypothetical protein
MTDPTHEEMLEQHDEKQHDVEASALAMLEALGY